MSQLVSLLNLIIQFFIIEIRDVHGAYIFFYSRGDAQQLLSPPPKKKLKPIDFTKQFGGGGAEPP